MRSLEVVAGVSPAELTAAATAVTAGVALFAAIFAGWQVWEIRRTREEQARPFVIVDIQPSPAWRNALNLVVENVGNTVAHEVAIRFDPALQSTRDDRYPLSGSVLLREGIPTLPPGRRIEALFDFSHERVKTDLPMRYDVTVDLRDARRRRQRPQRYVIDLAHLYGLQRMDEYGIHHAAKALREIERSVKKWSDVHGRLKVWIRDEDRHRLDEHVEYQLTGGYPNLGTAPPSDLAMTLGRNVFIRSLVRLVRSRLRRG
jgi:hypothetical protein